MSSLLQAQGQFTLLQPLLPSYILEKKKKHQSCQINPSPSGLGGEEHLAILCPSALKLRLCRGGDWGPLQFTPGPEPGQEAPS